MTLAKIIRILLTCSITILVIFMAILAGSNENYLEVLKQLMIPYSVVLGGHFGTDIVRNQKKYKIRNHDLS